MKTVNYIEPTILHVMFIMNQCLLYFCWAVLIFSIGIHKTDDMGARSDALRLYQTWFSF